MTLLTACQNVANEIALVQPSTIVGNTEETATRLLAMAKRSGLAIATYHDWTFLTLEHTFTTSANVSSYALPSGFDHFVDRTGWDRSTYWRLRGPLSPQDWQMVKSGLVASAAFRRWRIRPVPATLVNRFYVDPTPPATGSTLVFEYVTNTWAKASGGTLQSTFAADTDTVVFSQELLELSMIWRMLRALGQPYADEKQEFERELDMQVGRDGGRRALSLAPQPLSIFDPRPPDQGYG